MQRLEYTTVMQSESQRSIDVAKRLEINDIATMRNTCSTRKRYAT